MTRRRNLKGVRSVSVKTRGRTAGDVGLYAGLVGEYAGEVGLYAGLVGE